MHEEVGMDSLPVVVITQIPEAPVDLDAIRRKLEGRAIMKTVALPNRKLTPVEEDPYIEQMREAVVIFQRPGFITRRIVEAAPNLKFVITHGAGVDKIDLQTCADRRVWVGNVPGGNANAVAELVLAGMISLSRRLITANTSLHRGGWKGGRFVGKEISGGTLGIVGLGHVGRRLSELVKGFGTRVLFYDPYVKRDGGSEEEAMVQCESPHDLLKQSDFVSIHVPLTKATANFIGLREFELMKKESILANSSRGGIIDEEALCVALAKGMIGGAILDVFSVEPLPKSSPLRRLPNVILTPHIGGSTKECLTKIAERACDDILLVLAGQKPRNLVEISTGEVRLATRA